MRRLGWFFVLAAAVLLFRMILAAQVERAALVMCGDEIQACEDARREEGR